MLDLKPMIEEHKKEIERKTYTIKELAVVMGISEGKARQLSHAKGFPCITLGSKKLIVASKLDTWIEENIGLVIK